MFDTAKKPRVFILTSRIYETAGGRTKATIERMIFLQKYFDTTLIEMSAAKYPGQELGKIFEAYGTKFKVLNPWRPAADDLTQTQNYLELLRERTGALGDKKILDGAQESFILPTLSGGKVKSYLDDGRITRLREYHSDGKVGFYALDGQQNIILHELYDGAILLARHYLDASRRVCSGFTAKKDGTKQFVYRAKDDTIRYSENIADHNFTFLNDILAEGDVIISDVRYYDSVLARLKPMIRKVHVWHEIATKANEGEGKVAAAYEEIADPAFPMSPLDKIVVFTDDAREEYQARFPHLKDKLAVIPYGTDIKSAINGVERDRNLIISIGRLEAAQKNVAAQIQAFAIFNKKYPDTKLNIFGGGSDLNTLKKLAEELNLGEVVEFCGFSHNVDEEFQRAGMMIFSSRYETFGLTILESLSNGTPVASYDVRFGAKTMISNLQNGMVAKANTPESLADAMIKLHKSWLTQQQVKDSIVPTFSREAFERKWLAVITDGQGAA